MWIGGLRKDSSVGNVVSGGLYGFQPVEEGVTLETSKFRSLTLPSGVSVIREKVCSHLFAGDMLIVGGFSHNLRLGKNFGVVIQGIRAPSNPIVAGVAANNEVGVTVVAGPGLTADVVVALAFWDDNLKETSPPSDPSDPFTLVNQRLTVTPLPTFSPEDDRIIVGTSDASAATAIVGTGTSFLRDVRVGDKVSLSSAPTVFSKILSITDDENLVVATVIGDGTDQTILVRRQPRWTHVRVLYSVDGSLYRVAAQRELGVTTITPDIVTIGDLGESYAETFDQFPRCKFSSSWNNRQAMGGDEQDPTAIYFSLVDLPERRNPDLSLNTKDAKDVTAIFNVNDNLMVCTATSWQIVRNASGVDDIAIDFLDPELGVICNAATQIVHGNAWVLTNLGRYLCDGSSIIPMNKGDKRTFTKDLVARPQAYEDTFAIHDPLRHVYMVWMGQHLKVSKQRTITTTELVGVTDALETQTIVGIGTSFVDDLIPGDEIALDSAPFELGTVLSVIDDTHITVDVPMGNGDIDQKVLATETVLYVQRNAYMVVDYEKVIPQEGGQLGQPRLSWDVQARVDECAAILSMPGAKHGEVFTGSCDGLIYRHNVDGSNDEGDACGKEVFGLHGADAAADEGGDFAHGKTWKRLDVYADSEDALFDIELYPGDEYAYPDPGTIGSNEPRAPTWARTRGKGAKSVQVGPDTAYYEPKTVWSFTPEGITGRRLSLAFRARDPGKLRYRGYGVMWKEGPAPRRISRILRSE